MLFKDTNDLADTENRLIICTPCVGKGVENNKHNFRAFSRFTLMLNKASIIDIKG